METETINVENTPESEVYVPERIQQLIITLEGGKRLVYFGEAQVEVGDSLRIENIEFTEPRNIGDGWVDDEEE